ncbi:hypothetical protein [Herpetosiphon geysericola]|uniref:Uncharacterized protein n=1 Tax=Herpetosiphon geysericola TaxID=70996 RepID=A0A0P6YJT5_9CHLR|nr:hypothetical protein [Herpetosiphon geysericola]KPL89981.1 hypothetical protein SE18_08475 [Herpetosiphon geysericola]
MESLFGLSVEACVGLALIVILLIVVGVALARMHTDVNNLMVGTGHLVDRPPAWRWGKPDRAQRRRNARKK